MQYDLQEEERNIFQVLINVYLLRGDLIWLCCYLFNRPDTQLQTLVYKLVPGLYSKEMQRREDFYRTTGDRAGSSCSDDSVLGDLAQDHEEWVRKTNITTTTKKPKQLFHFFLCFLHRSLLTLGIRISFTVRRIPSRYRWSIIRRVWTKPTWTVLVQKKWIVTVKWLVVRVTAMVTWKKTMMNICSRMTDDICSVRLPLPCRICRNSFAWNLDWRTSIRWVWIFFQN